MKRKMTVGLIVIAGLATLLWGGSLTPPAPPTSGTMKPLNDVEPRIAIHQTDIPKTISASGSYYLAENVTISGSQKCITVNADDVTIDLGGFTMTGTDSVGSYGIYMNGRDNVEIRNGTIRDFNAGILESSSVGQNHRILGVRVLSCQIQGIYLGGCENCQVRDCTIADGCTITSASGSIYAIYVGNNGIVSGNSVCNNGTSTSCRPYGISTGSSCAVSGNTVYGNGTSSTADYAVGIWVGGGCTVTGNTVYDNGDSTDSALVYGIYVGTAGVVTGNTSHGNGDTAGAVVYGIYNNSGCTIAGNSVYGNGVSSTGAYVYGIFANSGGSVIGNTARSNGAFASGGVYGIYVAGNNLVNNNTAYLNAGTAGGTNMNMPASCVFGTNLAP